MSGDLQVDDAGLASVIQTVAQAATSGRSVFTSCADTSFLDEQVSTQAATFESTWRQELTAAATTIDEFAAWMQQVADTMTATDADLAGGAS